jgi:hypothetical protein
MYLMIFLQIIIHFRMNQSQKNEGAIKIKMQIILYTKDKKQF